MVSLAGPSYGQLMPVCMEERLYVSCEERTPQSPPNRRDEEDFAGHMTSPCSTGATSPF